MTSKMIIISIIEKCNGSKNNSLNKFQNANHNNTNLTKLNLSSIKMYKEINRKNKAVPI